MNTTETSEIRSVYREMAFSGQESAVADRRLEAFKKLVPHLRGALWWGRNREIMERNPAFNQSDIHDGHPLLSLRKEEVRLRGDGVPMLFGTTGKGLSEHRKRCCIDIVGLTNDDPGHHSYFGSIIEPTMYSIAEMLEGVSRKNGEYLFKGKDRHEIGRDEEKARTRYAGWYKFKAMIPNREKPIVSEDEMKMIDDFCLIHRL